ncbi:MAG TPA: SusE domain-containing protein [Chitinophagaceae bacterium]
MKRINFLLFSLLAVFMIAGCEKDENQVIFQGGTAPVLTASSTASLVLVPANAGNPAVKFSWTNPNYRFNTGISSQDVNYYLQVDTTGANFTNPDMQQVSISKDLELQLTVKELNTILSKMNLQENIQHNIEFRIKSTLGSNSVPLYSNVVKIKITPYLDVVVPIPPTGELYATGSAMPSDWTNSPPAGQKLTKVSNTEYYWQGTLAPGKQYKFLSNLGQWQPQYGAVSNTNNSMGGDFSANMGGGSDPNAFDTPSDPGTYKVTLNFKTGKYTVVKQ